jgi:DNA-binding NarL/FixJ family response regulator
LGLTPNQWQHFISTLSPKERQVFDKLRAGESIDAIAGELNLKTNQVMGEWSKLYLAAQELRAVS